MALFLPTIQDAKNANPDLKYLPDQGFSIMKPVKNDEWDFKEKGHYKEAKIRVGHKVEELTIEVVPMGVSAESGQRDPLALSIWNPKKQAEGELKQFSDAQYKDLVRKEPKTAKLPGGGAGNVNTSYVEATYKLEEKSMEFRLWAFVGKENQIGYMVVMFCEAGAYKKHQKLADFVLSSVKILKISK
jgi:hypothetical protein